MKEQMQSMMASMAVLTAQLSNNNNNNSDNNKSTTHNNYDDELRKRVAKLKATGGGDKGIDWIKKKKEERMANLAKGVRCGLCGIIGHAECDCFSNPKNAAKKEEHVQMNRKSKLEREAKREK